MFNDFIKHYNIIRSILRDVFLYGCFSREGLEEKSKVSSRKISYEIRRIQQYVEEEFIKADRDGRYKLLSLTYDSIRNTENFLVKTYMTKSFTRTDLLLYFYLLMALNCADKPLCLKELEEKLIGEGYMSYEEVSGKTIERKLQEMSHSLGVLTCNSIKRTKYYSIADDILKDFNNSEVLELLRAVSLCKNILFPVTAGYYTEQTLMDYLKYERNTAFDIKDYFQYKNLHFHPVIEEEILWKLLKAIHEKKLVTLNYRVPSNRTGAKGAITPVKPYKLRYDIQCGRFYLVSYDSSSSRCIVSRLDRIESVDILKEGYKQHNLPSLYERDMKYSWSSVPLNEGNFPETVKLEVVINEEKESYIIEKLKSEAVNSTITRTGEGVYYITLLINDSTEIIPWLRSYSGYIRVIEGNWLKQRLSEDWKEMLNSYGAL